MTVSVPEWQLKFVVSTDGQKILTEQGMQAANLTAYGDTSALPTTIATYLS
ncbi:hypothetical protein PR003_g315 [Phytophthora rubi]|uniref:Uncharacterized protein n=1 Tax=Phytophthora rubi TaxID=129364 RepID=A0A6A3NT46_9STRA|nr:hypothetical protein PR002_g882 [Phytophthora rubi]KAE9052651.1 hypothetical protein PR001_g323 [Phytophthora rubi]KAE9360240.1 hypothetical protein PR003_g315 [Phytophthora rubi]